MYLPQYAEQAYHSFINVPQYAEQAYHSFINGVSGLVREDASGEAGDTLLHLKRRTEEGPNTLNSDASKHNPLT